MSAQTPDIIDLLAAIEPGLFLDRIRNQRPETRINAQKSYLALFDPVSEIDVTRPERLALAAFVAGLHRAAGATEFYAAGLSEASGGASLVAAVRTELLRAAAEGPYGHYPAGPLSVEDRPGPAYAVSDFGRAVFGARLSAALEHAHLLVFRPREASPDALQKLLDAGWTTTAIVTLSQLFAFLSFQIRVVAALSALGTAVQARAPRAAAE
ncbi:CMD domain protein [Rhizobium sp. 16-449-1b]|uniref:CMD domain protein n=1 Tax=Rhizobium sp. 16-449-1b TaxID=2819989 RepID=UPI001ADB075C|nr:CMD domain protein [Rhizobium sp. 16-449-1b]MBO9195220.1 CMD domain protein [Rhizobium sp. 16-449-1b]